jgi:hypothetical protein
MRSYELGIVLFSLMPFFMIAAAAIVIGVIYIVMKFNPDVVSIIIQNCVVIWLIVVFCMIFMRFVCLNIQPYEQFDSPPPSTTDPDLQKLFDGITAAESDVCKLITRTDTFIQNDIGKAGQDNPQLVTDAQTKARGDITLTDCTADSRSSLDDAENRIVRMEATLKSFTGPELQSSYDRSTQCTESFDGSGNTVTVADLEARLSAVQKIIKGQQIRLLKPIDDKAAALRRGEMSDCDKRKGANNGIGNKNSSAIAGSGSG